MENILSLNLTKLLILEIIYPEFFFDLSGIWTHDPLHTRKPIGEIVVPELSCAISIPFTWQIEQDNSGTSNWWHSNTEWVLKKIIPDRCVLEILTESVHSRWSRWFFIDFDIVIVLIVKAWWVRYSRYRNLHTFNLK
jgi:hypothetical protein